MVSCTVSRTSCRKYDPYNERSLYLLYPSEWFSNHIAGDNARKCASYKNHQCNRSNHYIQINQNLKKLAVFFIPCSYL